MVKEREFKTENFICGGLAGMVVRTLICPLDRAKTILITNRDPSTISNFINILTNIYATSGIKGLWKANSINIIRVFPYASLEWGL